VIEILLVEDNPADVRLAQEALKRGRIAHHLSVVSDGEAALDFLHARGAYTDAPRPSLILLDLNLPKRDGREVLEEIKSDPGLRRIPVVVLTTSDHERDVFNAYDNHANALIHKPLDYEQFVKVVGMIEEFWLETVRLPKG
jgi:chemotaxis family two-component system response regulator Rcp1